MSREGPQGADLLVFDLGGVLIRICRDWAQACAESGVTLPADLSPIAATLHQLVALSETGAMEQDAFCTALGRELDMGRQQVHDACTAYLLGPYPGTHALLDELAQRGVATACLSNTNAHHWAMMTRPGHRHCLGLDRLDHRFASHLIGLRKPDPAIYRHVQEQTAVAPERILFFDDAPENVDAAAACGWAARLIDREGDPAVQIRDHLRRYDVLR